VGIIYRNSRPHFEENFPVLRQGMLGGRDLDRKMLAEILAKYQ
jgi:hypothetical protein